MPEQAVSDSEAAMAQLERRVAAQAAALEGVPLSMPVPAEVIALLVAVPRELDGVSVPPRDLPRLNALRDQVQSMMAVLTLRERELQGRIAAVRSARRAGPSASLIDYQS